MQHSANSNNKNGGNAQVQSVIIIAITLFALAGAILGFSLGALTHHSASNSQASNNSKANTSTNKNTKSTHAATLPTPAPTPPAQPLGGPTLTAGTLLTGAYIYTLQAKSDTNAPITTSGITCRIWLTKAAQGAPEIEASDRNEFQHIANVTNPLPHEIANGLNFDNTTPQTQSCKNGLGTWNITLSPSLAKGHYYIVGLTSNGTFFNWSWSSQITVN
jgi:hypothetical protein